MGFVEGGMGHSRKEADTLSDELFCIRGISILLVVVVHVLGVDAVHGVRKLFATDGMGLRVVAELIHSFNMAVMLMGSGVAVAAFGRADLSLSEFLRKKVNKLLVPMLVWAPVMFLAREFLRGRIHGQEGWLQALSQVPGTWFPPYAIFWFVHALVGCTLLAWLFRRFAGPVLGRWSGAVYFGLAVVLYPAVSAWASRYPGGLADYLGLILYWNRFFALGLLLHPWLALARRAIERQPAMLQALLPVGCLSLITLIYAVLPAEQYEVARTVNGPLGFCLLFSLSVFLRQRSSEEGAVWRKAWSRLVVTGSISMTIYLFHMYFVVGMRVALTRWLPEPLAAVHIVAGVLVGFIGPWVLFQLFKGQPLFSWSIGISLPAPSPRVEEARPAEPLAALPSFPKP
jgi:fucose 4-O-acetylase-like acetyltransferase